MPYGDVDGWRTYAAERGIAAPAAIPDASDTQALVRAQDYIRDTYVRRFFQGYDEDSDYVEEAVYEAASLERDTPGLFSKTYTPDQVKVLTKVEGLQWTPLVNKGDVDNVSSVPRSTKIEMLLWPYTNPGVATPLWSIA